MRLLFKYKIMLSFLIIEFFFLSVIIIYNYHNIEKFSKNVIDRYTYSNIKLFTQLIKTPVMMYDLATLDNITAEFSELPNVTKVTLLDTKKRVLSEFENTHNSMNNSEEHFKTNHPEIKFEIENDGILLGYGIVIFDMDEVMMDIEKQTQHIITIAIIEIIISIIVAFYLGKMLSQSLLVLDDACKQISSEQKEIIPIDIHSGDEFEHLADSFNKMQKNIQNEVKKNKENQQELLEKSKMAALGEMIGNIAHQWRQPLSVISTGATGLKFQQEYDLLTDDTLRETCDTINQNAQYLSRTIDDFKNFIEGNRDKEIFSLRENFESFLSLVEGSIKSNGIRVVLDLKEEIKLDGHKNELIQCYINIFNNSKDAFKEKGTENKLFFIKAYKRNNLNKVVIKFRDNAGGINTDVLPRIFEPYFTTKHKSQGTGLGLHMTYNLIVEGMKGVIKVKNVDFEYEGTQYKGTEFTIKV